MAQTAEKLSAGQNHTHTHSQTPDGQMKEQSAEAINAQQPAASKEQVSAVVAHIDELPVQDGVCALVGQRHVAVVKLSDTEVYALDNLDPFSKASVLSRGIVGDLKGHVVIASPIYKQHFDLKTGRCLEDEAVQIDTFPVTISDQGQVTVTVTD